MKWNDDNCKIRLSRIALHLVEGFTLCSIYSPSSDPTLIIMQAHWGLTLCGLWCWSGSPNDKDSDVCLYVCLYVCMSVCIGLGLKGCATAQRTSSSRREGVPRATLFALSVTASVTWCCRDVTWFPCTSAWRGHFRSIAGVSLSSGSKVSRRLYHIRCRYHAAVVVCVVFKVVVIDLC